MYHNLNALVAGGPAAVGYDPMFQRMNEQSLGNVQRLEAASGRSGSGNEMAALRDTGFNNQMDFFNQQYNRLATLSGANSGRTAPMQGMSSSEAYSNKMNTLSAQGSGFGMLLSGLQNIFGTSNNPQPSAQAVANFATGG